MPVEMEPDALFLRSVWLERFKAAFKPDAVVLKPFNVIIGRNGSGKSTVLEALQWVDRTLREDARKACSRYQGIHDLINLRSRADRRFFGMTLEWAPREAGPDDRVTYELQVDEGADGGPLVHDERIRRYTENGFTNLVTTKTQGDGRSVPGQRLLLPQEQSRSRIFDDPDRLALSLIGRSPQEGGESTKELVRLKDFWDRAVFLRLSPSSLAGGSPARRASFEPMLDEEGRMLPALLSELSQPELDQVVDNVRTVLRGIRDVKVTKPGNRREEQVYFSLVEEMPYVGRAGRGRFTIPAWMLSEGTRRITALFALLAHNPLPSLLCIEEIENGLDPWTTLILLRHLRAATAKSVQVVVTTHSPWLLDHVAVDDVVLVDRVKGDTRYSRARDRKEFEEFSADIPPGARYVNLEGS